jgi:GNAT superfamily N-acetyltransferase
MLGAAGRIRSTRKSTVSWPSRRIVSVSSWRPSSSFTTPPCLRLVALSCRLLVDPRSLHYFSSARIKQRPSAVSSIPADRAAGRMRRCRVGVRPRSVPRPLFEERRSFALLARPRTQPWVGRRTARHRARGFVNVLWDGLVDAWLQDTMVARTARHRGVGTELVAVAVAGVSRRGMRVAPRGLRRLSPRLLLRCLRIHTHECGLIAL